MTLANLVTNNDNKEAKQEEMSITTRLLAAGISYLSPYGTVFLYLHCQDDVDYHKALSIARITRTSRNHPRQIEVY